MVGIRHVERDRVCGDGPVGGLCSAGRLVVVHSWRGGWRGAAQSRAHSVLTFVRLSAGRLVRLPAWPARWSGDLQAQGFALLQAGIPATYAGVLRQTRR